MKKITLVLCACAMAFAGLLVSCSNDAGSGDVNLIYRDSTTYNYVYELTGTDVETVQSTPTGDKAEKLRTETTTTSFKGLAQLNWTVNDDTFIDYSTYTFNVYGLEEANEVVTVSESGTNAGTAPKPDHTDWLSSYTIAPFSFYKLDEKFYVGNPHPAITNTTPSLPADYAAWTDADWKDYVDNGGEVITVTGDIEEEDEITITVTSTLDNSSGTAVDKTTTVKTYKLKKLAAAEE